MGVGQPERVLHGRNFPARSRTVGLWSVQATNKAGMEREVRRRSGLTRFSNEGPGVSGYDELSLIVKGRHPSLRGRGGEAAKESQP